MTLIEQEVDQPSEAFPISLSSDNEVTAPKEHTKQRKGLTKQGRLRIKSSIKDLPSISSLKEFVPMTLLYRPRGVATYPL